MEKESLWEPGIGDENLELANEVDAVEIVAEISAEEEPFEIPDIPTVFPVPKESTPVKAVEPEPVLDLQTAKKRLKELKQQYRLEKKRQRCGWVLWLVGVLCTLLGGILGAVLTWFFLTK